MNGGGGGVMNNLMGGGQQQQQQKQNNGMSAPSADGSSEQKRAWFGHVFDRYVESYKQQGNDEATARNMAQRSLDQYKQQCLAQGIQVEC